MKFWESSALVPLLVHEASSETLWEMYRHQRGLLAWWASEIECASAVARLERDGHLSSADAAIAFSRLDRLRVGWSIVEPLDAVARTTRRFLRVHRLRAADAAQLAAAFVASESDPATLALVTLDQRLSIAAEREGFIVVGRGALDASSAVATE